MKIFTGYHVSNFLSYGSHVCFSVNVLTQIGAILLEPDSANHNNMLGED